MGTLFTYISVKKTEMLLILPRAKPQTWLQMSKCRTNMGYKKECERKDGHDQIILVLRYFEVNSVNSNYAGD